MKMILIKYMPRYDDCVEIIGIALNMYVAKKYVEDFKNKYHSYRDEYGRFDFEEHNVIADFER